MEIINQLNEKELVAYKQKLCEVMKAFIAFCDEHSLTYFVSGGTAIGVVRHQGIIPWDDDIDVYMLRPEYDRFLSLRDKLKGSKYEILDSTNNTLPIFPFAKFVDTTTTVWESEEIPFITGVWVDIFPLDEAKSGFSDEKERQIAYDYSMSYFNYLKSYNVLTFSYLIQTLRRDPFGEFRSFIWSIIHHRFRKKKYLDKILKLRGVIPKIKGDCYYVYGCHLCALNKVYPKEWFSSYTEMKFEDFEVKVLNGVHQYLAKQFGDYMSYPPIEEQQITHGHFYVNLKSGLSLKEAKNRIKILKKNNK